MDARMKKIEDMLKELLAQGQPSAPAAAPPATQDPELVQRIQDLEADKATMAEQLAEVRKLVEQQERVAATQQARYERSNRILLEGRFEDKETMKAQQKEILELKRRLQQFPNRFPHQYRNSRWSHRLSRSVTSRWTRAWHSRTSLRKWRNCFSNL
jgi:hypothetical protein